MINMSLLRNTFRSKSIYTLLPKSQFVYRLLNEKRYQLSFHTFLILAFHLPETTYYAVTVRDKKMFQTGKSVVQFKKQIFRTFITTLQSHIVSNSKVNFYRCIHKIAVIVWSSAKCIGSSVKPIDRSLSLKRVIWELIWYAIIISTMCRLKVASGEKIMIFSSNFQTIDWK